MDKIPVDLWCVFIFIVLIVGYLIYSKGSTPCKPGEVCWTGKANASPCRCGCGGSHDEVSSSPSSSSLHKVQCQCPENCPCRSRTRENFKVLGSLANQNELYMRCLYDCERTDPGNQLGKTHGNMMCLEYCDSSITEMTRNDGPTYLGNKEGKVKVVTPIDQSYERCGDGTLSSRCRSDYDANDQIDSKCRIDCGYSKLPNDLCMKECFESYSPNKMRGWSWK